MIDVCDDATMKSGLAIAEAIAKVEAASYTEKRTLAAYSEDENVLTVLSGIVSDSDAIRMLINNEHTPSTALKRIIERKTAAWASSKVAEPTDLETRRNETFVFKAIRHRNADSAFLSELSKNPDWHIRYGVAMQPRTSNRILRELTKDSNLAVRAMASARLGLKVDEGFDVRAKCSELNSLFDKVCKNLLLNKKLTDTMLQQLGVADEYDESYQFLSSCTDALKKLKEFLVSEYVSMVQARHVPNLDLEGYPERCVKLMDAFGTNHFDAYLIASKLKELRDDRARLSLLEINKQARLLLPFVKDETSKFSYASKMADAPEHIVNANRLKLVVHVDCINEYSTMGSEVVNRVEALDKLSRIVLTNADPATVQSKVSTLLYNLRGPVQMFQKHWIGGGVSTVRFFKNGSFVVEYETVDQAEKVAKALVLTGMGKSDEGGD